MQRLAATCALCVLTATGSGAADLYRYDPEPPLRTSHDWSGGYVGGHVGYGWGTATPGGGAGGGGLLGGLLGGTIDITGTGGLLDLGGLELGGLVGDLLDAIDADDLLDDILAIVGGTQADLAIDLEGVLDTLLDGESFDFGLRGSDLETEMSGFLGGAQIGYNIQQGSLVFGLEADVSATDLTDSTSFAGSDTLVLTDVDLDDLEIAELTLDAEVSGEVESEMNWLSTMRGRFGFAFDRVLIFGTGGLAMADLDLAATFTSSITATAELAGGLGTVVLDIPATTVSGSGGGLAIGYTLGAGVEYAINDNWSAKLEYAYINLGDVEVSFDDGGSMDMEIDMHLVKGGVNYYF